MHIYEEFSSKRREGEYPTLTVPCTKVLQKHCKPLGSLICINTIRVTKVLMIGVNSFVIFIYIDIGIVSVMLLSICG